MRSLGVIKSYPNNPRVAKALIAAAFTGATFDVQPINLATDRDAEFYAKHPLGKVPVFESAEVDLFESSSIAYYAASQEHSRLLGFTPVDKALIIQYVLFAENEIHTPTSEWLLPLRGLRPYLKPNVDAAQDKVKRTLGALDKILLTKTYLVGEEITFADISVVCALVHLFTLILDQPLRNEYKNVTRYFRTLVGQKHFKAHLVHSPKKEKKEVKKEEPKKEAKKEKKKEEPKVDDEDDTPKPAPKVKSPLDLLPPSKFVMDEWKRMYSNNKTDVAMKWFWENHDPQGYSLWRVDYKYNDELTIVFMSCNLIGGFFARLERARKYAFGSLIVCGENNNNSISGYFLIRGQTIPEEVYDAADFESYKFTKIEPSQYEQKKDEIYKYMAWEVEGCQDGKIFK
ncbi:hypothetical protein CLU79DRAFT_749153 [Phycomyces nitens]|nr:hypothetical protein CLU79DRAFT_749153 [Phycomyces nitens]